MRMPFIIAFGLALLIALPVAAQTWPSKQVTFVVGFLPGTGPDTMARYLAERLHERTGQKFIVANKRERPISRSSQERRDGDYRQARPELTAAYQRDYPHWAELIRASGAKID